MSYQDDRLLFHDFPWLGPDQPPLLPESTAKLLDRKFQSAAQESGFPIGAEIEGCLRQLLSASHEERCHALRALARVAGLPTVRQALIAGTNDDDEAVQREAIYALANAVIYPDVRAHLHDVAETTSSDSRREWIHELLGATEKRDEEEDSPNPPPATAPRASESHSTAPPVTQRSLGTMTKRAFLSLTQRIPLDETPEIDRAMRAVLRRARGGDAAAINELVTELQPTVRVCVASNISPFIRSKIDVGDLVQQSLTSICQNLAKFDYRGQASFLNWVRTHVRNQILNAHHYFAADKRREQNVSLHDERAANWSEPPDTSASDGYEVAIRRERYERVIAAIGMLPQAQAEIIRMTFFEGISVRQAARMLNLPESTVRFQRNKAFTELSFRLRPIDDAATA